VVAEDVLRAGGAGGRIIRGSAWRLIANVTGIGLGLLTASLLLHHLGVQESGRYVVVLSLIAITGTAADLGVTATASRELALRNEPERTRLIANVLGLRLVVVPVTIAFALAFSVIVGYPSRMIVGTALAGIGNMLASVAHSYLLRLTVELRNGGWAVVDFARQAVTLVGVVLLIAAGARLEPFFAVLIVTGLVLIALVPLVAGRGALVRPRFDLTDLRPLLVSSLPMALALTLAEVYFRLVAVLMSLISTPTQVGYYGGSLRAMESLVDLPTLIIGVALPLLAAAARDDRARLRYAIDGLSRGAVIVGVLLVLVTVRAAEPVMTVIGGHDFRPAGAVLRIHVGAILFLALYEIWSSSLLALNRQRDLIRTNVIALAGLAVFSAILVPMFGAQGGAAAGVLGDALLAGLVYLRLRPVAGTVMVTPSFMLRVLIAAAVAVVPLVVDALPALVAAALSGLAFLGVGQLVGMIPPEIHVALDPRRHRSAT
jgi:O-antigen/teichoic acid export membrane protein